MLKFLLIVYGLLLNSCVALSQDSLTFIDFTVATERPEFTLEDMNNGQASYDTRDYEGAAFVIEWYFASCPACNQNSGNVKRLQSEFRNNPKVQIVELSIDCQNSQYNSWISRHRPLGPVLYGCNQDELVRDMGVSRFPTTIVYAPNKREAMRGIGVWSRSQYDRIKRYLDQVSK